MRYTIRGSSNLGCLIWLLIMGAVFYVGYKFTSAQWAYLTMKEDIHEVARIAASEHTLNIEHIQQEVEGRGEKLGIAISPEDIRLEESETSVTINVSWEVAIDFPFYTYYQEYSVNATHRKGL